MSVSLQEPYAPRPVTPLGVEAVGEWRVKVYGIAYNRPEPREALVEAALAVAAAHLPRPAVTDARYGVAVLGIHDGRGANFAFLDWWQDENELHHRVFRSSTEAPAELRAATGDDPVACTWDLRVIAHERDAWVRHVLARHSGPDLDAYLADVVSGEV